MIKKYLLIITIIFFLFSITSSVSSQTPLPTRVNNSATATAIAPPPPLVTPTPTLIPQSFSPGGEYDAITSIWFNKLITLVFVGILIWVVYLLFEIRHHQIEANLEIKLAEIKAMQIIKVNPRPITSVSLSDNGKRIKLSNGEKVDKLKIVEFIKSTLDDEDETGLVISKWKLKEGWLQEDIENILDHLASVKMITPRQSGKVCEWLTVPTKKTLSHIFRLSVGEVV